MPFPGMHGSFPERYGAMVSDGDSFVRERAHNEKSDGARPEDVGPDAVGLGGMMPDGMRPEDVSPDAAGLGGMMPDGVRPDDMTPDAAMTGNA